MDNSKECNSMEKYMQDADKRLVEVPDVLEERIRQRVKDIKPAKHYGRNIAAACLVFLLIFAAGIRLSPDFAAYAAAIPGMEAAVKWIQGDRGIQNAKEHGYKEIEGFIVEEDGYSLNICNIMMDEDRIHLTATAWGGEIDRFFTLNRDSNNDLKEAAIGDKPEEIDYLHLNIRFMDFENPGAFISSEGNDQGMLIRRIEKIFKDGDVRGFVGKAPDHLTLEAVIWKGREELFTFKPIKLPINAEDVMLSKIIRPDVKLSYEKTSINIKQLIISPTRMKIDLTFDMEEGYSFAEFENAYLKDEKGNVYKPEGLVSTHNSPLERSMYFVPSIYFERLPEKLYFCFDGVRIAADEGRSFDISLSDKYPRTIEYMGHPIVLREVEWSQSRGLIVTMELPKSNDLKIQGINIRDYHESRGWGTTDGEYKKVSTYFNRIERRETYEVELEFPGLLIKSNTKCEIPLK